MAQPNQWGSSPQITEEQRKHFKQIREAFGATIRDFATAIGYAYSTVYNLESGRSSSYNVYQAALDFAGENKPGQPLPEVKKAMPIVKPPEKAPPLQDIWPILKQFIKENPALVGTDMRSKYQMDEQHVWLIKVSIEKL